MIRVLPKEVADKIAAGEVIENPVSIVKELIENSIDAEASAITCEIKRGGKEEIRVTDNGIGIPGDEVLTAFLRHATSKIYTTEDIKSINTLGFRGEALPSIAAVSRTELITKTIDGKVGTRLSVHGGEVVTNEGIGCPEGTTIIVKDLFYNLPARLKFLKSEAAESSKVIDMMSKLALTRPDIKFTLISNGKTVFNTSGNGNLKDAILSIYKDREYKELIEVDHEDVNGITVKGYISRPSFTRANRRSQYYFVNGRTVKNRFIEKGVDLGYKERVFDGRYPIVFLFITIDPKKLDVNVHPNKKEVRFNDDIAVVTAVERAVLKTITSRESVVKVTDTYKIIEKDTNDKVKPIEKTQIDIKAYLKDLSAKDVENTTFEARETAEVFETKNEEFSFDDLEIRDIIFGTYITASDGDNYYFIDQHAAHERVNYEKFLAAYLSEKKESQLIMAPFTFDVPLDMMDFSDDWTKALINMGYGLEVFGDNTYIVREIPTFTTLAEAESFVNSYIDEYHKDKITMNNVVVEKLITRACKSSIKANDFIKDEEAQALINELKQCKNPFSCPHGRPTFIKLSKYDIEKMFKRVQ